MQTWSELGTYNAYFSSFGRNIYKNDIARSCIRALAEHTSKANARCTNQRIEKLLNDKPNMYMNGKDFLTKIRTKLEIQNTAFIYIMRDNRGQVSGFYPVPYSSFQALEYDNGLYIQFQFAGSATRQLTFAWEDLAVVRKDYNESDIAGDDNNAIIPLLQLVTTTNEGVANAVKATANLRGILKSTKGMLSPEDRKKQKEEFVKDYLNLENEGGIASIDNTQEFTPISMNPTVVNQAQMKEFRENVYRYFGVNDSIIMSDFSEEQMEAFYESRIEPFLVALSTELTTKCFTEKERAFGNCVVYESSRMQFASNKTKLALVSMVDRGALTPNEWRFIFGLAPVEGGDVPIRRLDTAEVSSEEEGVDEDGNQDE